MASDSSAYDLEYRDNGDDAWYAVNLVMPEFGVTLTVKYLDFPDSCDVTFRADQFTTASEVDELMNRFRPVSRQMQDDECDKITNGVTVCASYSFGTDDLRFYDAVVKAVHHEKHSFVSGEEECLCTFVLLWQHGPNVGNQTSAGIGSICILQQAAAQVHPRILRFSKAAKERIASELAKSTNVSKGDSDI
ncbi:hypothetical protein Fot_38047 [Forsythia ovata]|uniref:SAWADEE domain-containing protein n=1 Tax=Forsythia ovata TaxID=205694 RepID=A0ABD1S0Q7_9LAMI